MTIYAIINGMLPESRLSRFSGPVWTLISQSSILQGGNPYFVPDFALRFEARMALAVRIGKLGKGIAPRFAGRYVEAVAPAVLFVAADRLSELMDESLPWTSAISYDRALALGKFKPIDITDVASCECSLRLDLSDGFYETLWTPGLYGPPLEETIEAISRDNTLKTGDILLIGLSGSGQEVKTDCRATLGIDGEECLAFNIR